MDHVVPVAFINEPLTIVNDDHSLAVSQKAETQIKLIVIWELEQYSQHMVH
jgi:hypothetical protein